MNDEVIDDNEAERMAIEQAHMRSKSEGQFLQSHIVAMPYHALRLQHYQHEPKGETQIKGNQIGACQVELL